MITRSSKGIADILLVAVVALVAIPTAAFIGLTNQNSKTNSPTKVVNPSNIVSPENAAGNLYLSPAALTVAKNSVFPLEVWADAKGQGIPFFNITLSFDKKILSLSAPTEINPDFKTIVNQTSLSDANSKGLLKITAAVPGGSYDKSPRGKVKLLTLTFKGINKGEANVSILKEKTQIVLTYVTPPPVALPINTITGKYKIN